MANAVRLQAMNNYYGHNPYQLPALPMPMYPYMAGSPYTEGSSSSSNAMSPSLAFRGVQMPSVVNTPALMPSSGMSQMVLPRMNAYFTTGMPMPVPCGCLARAESFPAMCQQMYASHYHMHQHPVGNAQITLPTSGIYFQNFRCARLGEGFRRRVTLAALSTCLHISVSMQRVYGWPHMAHFLHLHSECPFPRPLPSFPYLCAY